MENQLVSTVTVESVIEGLRNLVVQNGNNVEAILDKLQVPSTEIEQTKIAINKLFNGDETLVAEIGKELSSMVGENDLLVASTPGGVTKRKVLKKCHIPYGERIYISHKDLEKVTDMMELGAIITGLCGVELLAGFLALDIWLLKKLDIGNGVIINHIPIWENVYIPSRQ